MRHILFILTALILTFPVFGQQVVIRNPEIQQLVQQVNADSLKKYTEKLASFHSRHTLNRDDKNGMLAAQNYVKAKFLEFAGKSKGRMTANIEEFVVPVMEEESWPMPLLAMSSPNCLEPIPMIPG